MKHIIILLFACLPMMATAQSSVDNLSAQERLEQAKRAAAEAKQELKKAKQELKKAKQEAKLLQKAQKQEEKALQQQAKIEAKIQKAEAEAAKLRQQAEKQKKATEKLQQSAAEKAAEQAEKASETTEKLSEPDEKKETLAPEAPTAVTEVTNKTAEVQQPTLKQPDPILEEPDPVVEQVLSKEKAPVADTTVTMEDIYLDNAVPEIDGKVVFTLDLDIQGKTAAEIYDLTHRYLNALIHDNNQTPEAMSRVSLTDENNRRLAANLNEWMLFSKSAISIDRARFIYTLIADCTDGHLHMTMSRIIYSYEENREGGFRLNAEELITDKHAVLKKKHELKRSVKKFRVGTIDRKNQIFKQIERILNN